MEGLKGPRTSGFGWPISREQTLEKLQGPANRFDPKSVGSGGVSGERPARKVRTRILHALVGRLSSVNSWDVLQGDLAPRL